MSSKPDLSSSLRSAPSNVLSEDLSGSGSTTRSSNNEDGANFVGLSRKMSTPHLGENISRKIERDPYEVYEHTKVLGSGSMGSVHMVRKRDSNVGGTARWHNLSTEKKLELRGLPKHLVVLCTLPIVGNLIRVCAGIDEEEEKESPLTGMFGSGDLNVSRRGGNNIILSTRENNQFVRGQHHDSSRERPNAPTHIRINNFLEKEKRRGYYEAHYAMKSIHLDRIDDITYVNELKNEIEIMRRLDHPHLAKLIETYEDKREMFLILELCSGGDLYSRDPYTEDQAARIVGSILSAVDFMHQHDIIHRDLKYENILFANPTPTAEIKIIDFGLSKMYTPSQRLKEGVGTVYTMAPEVVTGNYNNKADVWAVGVLAYMLLSSQMPFFGRRRKEILDKIARCNYDFKGRRWSAVSKQAGNFIIDLLMHDPEARPSAREAKQSLWLNMRLTSSVRTATEDDMDAAVCSLEHYSTHKTLQKLALMVVAHKSNSEEIGYLRNVFKRYDKSRHGTIVFSEFKQCLSKYNYEDAQVEKLFHAADLNGSGKVNYTEFLAATIESTDLVTEERLAEAFDHLDSTDSGYITVNDIRGLLGEEVPNSYIEQVVAEAGINQADRVTYEDFLHMWKQEIEDRQIKAWRGISKQRTVSALEDEMLYASGDETYSSDDEVNDTSRLVSIAEIEERKSRFFSNDA